MKEEFPKLQHTPKLLTLADTEKIVTDQKMTLEMKRPVKYIEEVEDYLLKVARYNKTIELIAEIQNTEDKPFTFFYPDSAEMKKNEINRFYGKEVATVAHGKLGQRDSYKVIMDRELMRSTYQDILGEGDTLLESRKDIAA